MMTVSILLKWTVIVWLNAAVSFFFAMQGRTTGPDTAGICFAVFTFVGIYAYIDLYLLNTKQIDLRAQLLWSALLKSLTQFVPYIEFFTGSLSFSIVQKTYGINLPFLTTYLITMVDGIILSFFVLLLMPLVKLALPLLKAKPKPES